MAVYISRGEEQTRMFAAQYARSLKAGDVVLLEGDMGAGKTVFAQGVALGLGIDDDITSPTYAYMNDYYGKLYHYDCYRLSSGAQAEALGLCDYFNAGGICLIEWAQNIADVLPENCKKVVINKISDNAREIIYG
ncbi:MAG TPA: tRNA (adenosine(37)-N6)-threonylcarbamoyltransferase complex ATPase subunit type 1 TsaE [Candidatus Coproplasma avicola]|uniref:tRNA threonylcarbamoyladenosine biosynthesis protein TsaE n=1 Tax=Candidatus Coproplasma avicola TaxID=2840744 RepID=A0A9D1J947_9FIRM|nr:tRNA (adenosine(37)-N6)-threonylcarbamoyltransferase complex ATPase subunit type 1 TsaE [Candidatus Coproplasma avicola]